MLIFDVYGIDMAQKFMSFSPWKVNIQKGM